MAAIGMEVGEAFSTAIEQILAHPELGTWEYILTIEHDNMPPADGVLKLLEQMEANPKFACIGGLYFTKGHGGVAQDRAGVAVARRERGGGRGERQQEIASNEGVWECSFVGACSEVCPEHVDPAGALQQVKIKSTVDWYQEHLLPGSKK
jgi:hypothetical protein